MSFFDRFKSTNTNNKLLTDMVEHNADIQRDEERAGQTPNIWLYV